MAKQRIVYSTANAVRKVLKKYKSEKNRHFIINQMTTCWKIGYQQGKNVMRSTSPRR